MGATIITTKVYALDWIPKRWQNIFTSDIEVQLEKSDYFRIEKGVFILSDVYKSESVGA